MIFNVVNLKDVSFDVTLFGGKAVMLSKIMNSGLKVPEGFVVPSNVYQLYKRNKLDENAFKFILNQWLVNLNMNSEVIVRSSASVENITNVDCPGIFESFVCSEKENLLDTIKKVWDSATSTTAQSFFSKIGYDIEEVKMAVIIQNVIRGKFNSVIQSYDVVENKHRIMVEYCCGEINSIVDDNQEASLCSIEYNEITINEHYKLPIYQIRNDCILIESIVGGYAEIEAQITDNCIWYIQARNIGENGEK